LRSFVTKIDTNTCVSRKSLNGRDQEVNFTPKMDGVIFVLNYTRKLLKNRPFQSRTNGIFPPLFGSFPFPCQTFPFRPPPHTDYIIARFLRAFRKAVRCILCVSNPFSFCVCMQPVTQQQQHSPRP
jgi:hypothetical protein